MGWLPFLLRQICARPGLHLGLDLGDGEVGRMGAFITDGSGWNKKDKERSEESSKTTCKLSRLCLSWLLGGGLRSRQVAKYLPRRALVGVTSCLAIHRRVESQSALLWASCSGCPGRIIKLLLCCKGDYSNHDSRVMGGLIARLHVGVRWCNSMSTSRVSRQDVARQHDRAANM